MFAMPNGLEGDWSVSHIRRGDDDSVDILAFKNLRVVRRRDHRTGLLTGAAEGGFVRIADCENLCAGAKRKPWQVVLEGDSTATNDGKVQLAT
jgi:hypothetical protein